MAAPHAIARAARRQAFASRARPSLTRSTPLAERVALNARTEASTPSSGRTSAASSPLGPGPEARQHGVARLGIGEAVAPQRLHVDEDVLGALAARQEAEAARAIEPLDDDDLERADRGRLRARARRRQLRAAPRPRPGVTESTRNTCKPRSRRCASATTRAPS